MKLKKSKDELKKVAEVDTKAPSKNFTQFFSGRKDKELSRQELKKKALEAAKRPTAKQRVQKVFSIMGKVLLVLFVVAVIFSMVALPILIVFQ